MEQQVGNRRAHATSQLVSSGSRGQTNGSNARKMKETCGEHLANQVHRLLTGHLALCGRCGSLGPSLSAHGKATGCRIPVDNLQQPFSELKMSAAHLSD